MTRFIILTAALLATACSKDATTTHKTPTNITLSVSTGSTDSRIAIDEQSSTSDSWKFVWEEDEPISVWYSGSTALSTFEMDSYDPALSTFKGDANNATQLRLIHPKDAEGAVNGSKYTLDISEQDGALSKLYMMSEGLVAVDGNGEVSTTPEMKHLGGFFALYFKLDNATANTTYKITKVKLSGVPTSLEADMEGDFLNENTTFYDNINSVGTITATLSNTTFDSDNEAEVRLNTLPFSYNDGDTLTFDITFEINGNEYTSQVIKTNNSGSAILFERAKFNYSTITLDGSTGLVKVTDCTTIANWDEGTQPFADITAQQIR